LSLENGVWLEFLVRAGGTALVVVTIAWAAARLGPVLGGILVGLPIVLAPGFFFLLQAQTAEFSAIVAVGTLYSLIASQVFLVTFLLACRWGSGVLATLAAIAGWIVAAIPLAAVPHHVLAGVGLFAISTTSLWLLGGRFLPAEAPSSSGTRWLLLIARGVAGGLLVGSVTLTANALGPSLSGTLMGFPIGFCVVLLSLSLDHGTAVAARTAHAGILGTLSLAGFLVVMALTLPVLPAWGAFTASLATSLLVTAALGWLNHLARRLR
jgi:hypothetical protein